MGTGQPPTDTPRVRRRPQWALALILVVVVVIVAVTAGHAKTTAKAAPGLSTVAHVDKCPASDHSQAEAAMSGKRTQEGGSQFVPSGATSLLLCRYNGLKDPPPIDVPGKPAFGLVASATVHSRASIATITGGLNAIKIQPPNAVFNCPADFGRYLFAYFGYPSGRDYAYAIDIDGCQTITSGKVYRMGLDAAILGRLLAPVPVRT